MVRLFRGAFAVSLMCISLSAAAQDAGKPKPRAPDLAAPHIGAGVICDTAKQVERYLSLHTEGQSTDVALGSVNAEAQNPSACGVSLIAFVADDEIGKVAVSNGIMHLMKITVLAAKYNAGWQRIPPTIQYTALFEKAIEV